MVLGMVASPPPDKLLSRRIFLGMTGFGLTALVFPGTLVAQPAAVASELRARAGAAKLRGEGQAATAILGFDGVTPGPLLRAKRGEDFNLRVTNELAEPIAIHWYGMRISNGVDGGRDMNGPLVAPGASFAYRFRPPDAGTFWYRAVAADQVSRGLYGLMIVDDTAETQVDREVILILDDWPLETDGALVASPSSTAKAQITVNGLPRLDISVRTNERVRFRILNASTARALSVRIDQHRPIVMAIDGQPSEPFPARDARVTLAPGNRVDLFVDTLLSADASAPILIGNGGEETPIARIVYERGAPARPVALTEPRALPPPALPAKMDLARAQRRELPVDAGANAPPQRQALLTVKRGQTVVLALPNRTAAAYAMHLHGHHFRLLDALDDGWKPFWLDTVVVPPSQTTRIAFVADNPGKWPVRCTRLGDGAPGADRWFEVT